MSKFDAAIDRLYASIDDSGREYGSRWVGKIKLAIRLLEAAAKVDKEAWKYIIANLDSCRPSFVELDQMGTLLAALPDKEDK